jgi:hypothetical protein
MSPPGLARAGAFVPALSSSASMAPRAIAQQRRDSTIGGVPRLRARLRRAALHCVLLSAAASLGGTPETRVLKLTLRDGTDASLDLEARWRALVAGGSVQSETVFEGRRVRYGLREAGGAITDFAELADGGSGGGGGGAPVDAAQLERAEGEFVLRLVANRRLRPPPAFERSSGAPRSLPPHDEATCAPWPARARPTPVCRAAAAVPASPTAAGSRPRPRRPSPSRMEVRSIMDMTTERFVQMLLLLGTARPCAAREGSTGPCPPHGAA